MLDDIRAGWIQEGINMEVRLIKIGKGGSCLTDQENTRKDWLPVIENEYFDESVYDIRQALSLRGGNDDIHAIVWIQGECDALAGVHTSDYATAERLLVQEYRNEFGQEIPFFSVLLNEDHPDIRDAVGNARINGAKHSLENILPNYYTISADGLSHTDGVHYDTSSVLQLGSRIATAILSVVL